MMLGGAILNATTVVFILRNIFQVTIHRLRKKKHDKALEKYQKDYAKYQENREKLLRLTGTE